MENLVWIIYFADVFTSEGGATGLAFIVIVMSLVLKGLLLAEPCSKSDKELAAKIPLKTICALCSILFLYGWLMPSKDTAYKMLAAYGAVEVASNERVKDLAGKSLDVLEKAMGEYLEESKGE